LPGKIVRRLDAEFRRILGRGDRGARYTNYQFRSSLSKSQADERPFFVFVSYLEAHIPYRPAKAYNRFLPNAVSCEQAQQVNQDRWKYLIGQAPMEERDFEILTALYDASLAYLDARIAELLGWLEESGLLDQTMVIITADHGEELGEHQLMAHGYCLYDSVLHVPLIIHYPRGTTSPGRVPYQVQAVDLLPTVLTVAGDTASEAYRAFQGNDLLSATRREYTIAEEARPDFTAFHRRFPGEELAQYDRALQMIRTDRHKFIWASDGRHELYDLQVDPDEMQDLVADCPEIAADLEKRLEEWRRSFEPVALSPQMSGT
jgi:arylsulfatase A-like enzyme